MKKLIIAALFVGIFFLSNAQTFKTKYYLAAESEFKTNDFVTDIIITPTLITIKKFESGRTEDSSMKVDRIETKPYGIMDRPCSWYFCTDTKKDVISGTYYKGIFVYDKVEKSIIYASFADEISMYWYKFYLK